MKFVVIANRVPGFGPEQFAPHLASETAQAFSLYADGTIREIYSRSDGKGAILVLEAANEAEVRTAVETLPLAKLNMLTFDIYGANPYRGIVQQVRK